MLVLWHQLIDGFGLLDFFDNKSNIDYHQAYPLNHIDCLHELSLCISVSMSVYMSALVCMCVHASECMMFF